MKKGVINMMDKKMQKEPMMKEMPKEMVRDMGTENEAMKKMSMDTHNMCDMSGKMMPEKK